ncbi:MAG: hypothetical protein V5B78_08060 [Desulfohalobiaceae bacterium]
MIVTDTNVVAHLFLASECTHGDTHGDRLLLILSLLRRPLSG